MPGEPFSAEQREEIRAGIERGESFAAADEAIAKSSRLAKLSCDGGFENSFIDRGLPTSIAPGSPLPTTSDRAAQPDATASYKDEVNTRTRRPWMESPCRARALTNRASRPPASSAPARRADRRWPAGRSLQELSRRPWDDPLEQDQADRTRSPACSPQPSMTPRRRGGSTRSPPCGSTEAPTPRRHASGSTSAASTARSWPEGPGARASSA